MVCTGGREKPGLYKEWGDCPKGWDRFTEGLRGMEETMVPTDPRIRRNGGKSSWSPKVIMEDRYHTEVARVLFGIFCFKQKMKMRPIASVLQGTPHLQFSSCNDRPTFTSWRSPGGPAPIVALGFFISGRQFFQGIFKKFESSCCHGSFNDANQFSGYPLQATVWWQQA